MNLKKIFAATALAILLTGCAPSLSADEAQDLAQKFIDENLISGDMTAEITSVEEKSGLWNLNITLSNGREVQSMLTFDGKIFVKEAYDIEEIKAKAAAAKEAAQKSQATALADLPKSEKPVVELFVMSYCPYGTQEEKAIIPALEALDGSVDFQLKFVNYTIHGPKEVTENLLQYAISKDYPEKLIPYLKEFLVAGDSTAALAAVDLSTDDLAATIVATDAEFKITENLDNEELWLKNQDGTPAYPHFDINAAEVETYGVKGSPTLVVNGETISSDRTPSAMLATICAGFETAPEACSTELSIATSSSGFGVTESADTASDGECS